MANTTLNVKIQIRNDVANTWKTTNPVLLEGEMGIETDTRKFKFGDGVSTWTELDYASAQAAVVMNKAPTPTDSGYDIGVIWIDTAGNKAYVLFNNTSNNVIWKQMATPDDLSDLAAAANNAKDDAVTAKEQAETAQGKAEEAQTAAEAAQAAAEDAQEGAETAETNAGNSATAAAESAIAAAEHDILTQTEFTDEQKAIARQNIDAAKKSGSYELIETITLTENVASIVRTQEPDGTLYNFKAIGVVVSAEIGSVNSGINVMAKYNATILNSAFINGAISTSIKKYGYAQIYPEFGVWTGIGSTAVNGFSWTVTQMTGYSPMHAFAVKESENPYCTQMMMQANMPGATIPAETVISIYGVRA